MIDLVSEFDMEYQGTEYTYRVYHSEDETESFFVLQKREDDGEWSDNVESDEAFEAIITALYIVWERLKEARTLN